MRQSIKKYTPKPVWQLGSGTYWWWHNRGRHVLARILNPLWMDSKHKLRQFENSHQCKRCFIIGNGPSLRQTDLTKLRDQYTFGFPSAFSNSLKRNWWAVLTRFDFVFL